MGYHLVKYGQRFNDQKWGPIENDFMGRNAKLPTQIETQPQNEIEIAKKLVAATINSFRNQHNYIGCAYLQATMSATPSHRSFPLIHVIHDYRIHESKSVRAIEAVPNHSYVCHKLWGRALTLVWNNHNSFEDISHGYQCRPNKFNITSITSTTSQDVKHNSCGDQMLFVAQRRATTPKCSSTNLKALWHESFNTQDKFWVAMMILIDKGRKHHSLLYTEEDGQELIS